MSPRPVQGVANSVRLNVTATLGAGLLQFAAMAILARLLVPQDYGVYAIALAIVSLSSTFVANVVERMLVVRGAFEAEADDSPSIALLSATAGAGALALCLLFNLIGIIQLDLGLIAILTLAALTASLAVFPRARLRREIRFGPIAAAELLALVLGPCLTAICLADAGWGAYALALAAWVQSAVLSAMLLLLAPKAALTGPSWKRARHLARSSLAAGGSSAAEIANGQLPSVILGSTLGAVPLGLYNRSYGLIQTPIQLLIGSINRVMISALFAVQDDTERLRSVSRSLVVATAITTTPIAAGLAGASGNFVALALGPAWLAATAIVPIIALSAWAAMMGALFGIIAEAKRAFADKTRVQITSSILLIALTAAGSTYGLTAAVAGIALASIAFLILSLRLAARQLQTSSAELLAWLAPGVHAALPCLATSLAVGHLIDAGPLIGFAVQAAGCAAAYFIALPLLSPASALHLLRTVTPGLLAALPPIEAHLRQAAEARRA